MYKTTVFVLILCMLKKNYDFALHYIGVKKISYVKLDHVL